MGMFSYKSGYVSESAIDMDAIEAQPCYEENAVDSAYRIMAENQDNWNAIMEAVGIDELAIYESTGSEIVYEAGNISGIFTKIKEFFKKLLEKIKGIFSKFMTVINSWTQSDKAFVKKYKKDLYSANLKDLEFKGYKFSLDKYSLPKLVSEGLRASVKDKAFGGHDNIGVARAEEYNNKAKELRDKKEEFLDSVRGKLVYGDSSDKKVDSSDFSKELFEVFRSGESEKDTLDEKDIDISACLVTIENTEKNKKDAEKAYKEITRGISDAIKEIDDMSKGILRDTPNDDSDTNSLNSAKVSYYSALCSLGESTKSLVTVAFGAYIQAIKDNNRQCKAICVKALTRKQPKNESSGSYYEEGGSMLASVSFK